MFRAIILLTIGLSFSTAAKELDSLKLVATPKPIERMLEGRVEAISKATVSAETSGRVDAVLVDVGDHVAAGSVILTLVGSDQKENLNQATAALNEAITQSDAEAKQFARVKALYDKELLSKSNFDEANARYKTAKERVTSARAALKRAQQQVSYTEIKAAYSGVVSARHVEVGEAVILGMPLMSGFDADHLRVSVDLPQSTAKTIKQQPLVRIILADHRSLEPIKTILFPIADIATSTVTMRLVLPEKTSNLYPGELVKVAVQLGIKNQLMVPASSIVYRSELVGIYVIDQTSTTRPRLRQIRIGDQLGGEVEVLAGLSEGESIALDPVAAGLMAMKKSSDKEY